MIIYDKMTRFYKMFQRLFLMIGIGAFSTLGGQPSDKSGGRGRGSSSEAIFWPQNFFCSIFRHSWPFLNTFAFFKGRTKYWDGGWLGDTLAPSTSTLGWGLAPTPMMMILYSVYICHITIIPFM